ncbi:hypothetical protein E4U14_006798 [Claviceps sp. LM454 group G7]|nr:hypothetical protein E4U14_006798 [Claviceps sp. LM454 group G7]
MGVLELVTSCVRSTWLFALLHLVAPKPRPSTPSEKTYVTSSPSGEPTTPRQLPCWYDRWLAERRLQKQTQDRLHEGHLSPDAGSIEPAEVRLSVVFPAYNEEKRIIPTLEEAVDYLDEHVGRHTNAKASTLPHGGRRHHRVSSSSGSVSSRQTSGYEILIVNDGSRDKTVEVALDFARKRGLHDILKVVSLVKNRGKGGSVTHGLRHVRGEYVLFADADGASRFSDVGKLIEGCEEVVDGSLRGVAIGSRAHLVGSEAVVKASSISPSEKTTKEGWETSKSPLLYSESGLPPFVMMITHYD